MNIIVNSNIKPKLFKDLESGDVFYFLKKCAEDMKEIDPRLRIYMKCGGSTSMDRNAINLETGFVNSFDGNESVVPLDATLTVTQIKHK